MNWLQKMVGSVAVKMGASLPPPTDDWWYTTAGPTAGITGVRVDPNTAMQATAVWACIRLITETISNLPLVVYRRTESGKERAQEHPLYRVVHDSANREQPAKEFWAQMIQWCLRYGNAYARITYDTKMNVESLTPIHPCRIRILRDLTTDVKAYEYTPKMGRMQVLFDDDIFHLPYSIMDEDGLGGLSPIEAHRRTMELGITADEFRLRFMANDARPGVYLKHPTPINEETARAVKNAWREAYGGIRNVNSVAVFGNGIEVGTFPSGMGKDMEFVQQMKFDVEQICRIFGVPLHLVQSLDQATNNNIEHQGISALTYLFLPWLNRIEGRIQHHLLGPIEGTRYFAEFVMDGLLRADSVSRSQLYTAYRNSGIMTANEIRALENMNPIEGGDKLMIQGAMVPIDMAGMQQQQKAVAK